MHKNEFIRQVAKESGVSQAIVGQVLSATIRVIGRSLIAGSKVVWTGFGTFEMRQRSTRRGINPQTGEQITIAATMTPGFTASSTFKNRIAGAILGADTQIAPVGTDQRLAGPEEALERPVAPEAALQHEHQPSASPE